MNRPLVVSVAANALIAVVFVGLNSWALQLQLEETFVSLAVTYGILSIGLNAACVGFATRERTAA